MTYKAEAPTKKSDQLGFRPKRFWTSTAATAVEGGTGILLDGRPVKTPQGRVLILPTLALAQKIEAEWAAVKGHVDFEDMPLTRLGFASVDRMDEVLDATVTEVLRYAETDLVCYPAEYPQSLQDREAAAWQAVLDWCTAELGLTFIQNKTLIYKPQSSETLIKIQSLIEMTNAYERAGIMQAIPLFGSVVLALALWRGHLSGEAAFQASRIGEDFQAETWGRDEEAAKRTAIMQAQAVSLDIWFRSLA